MIEKITLVNENSDAQAITMDMTTAPGFILESVDIGPVVGKHNTYKYFNQLGETIGSTAIGTREVSITGWIVAVDATDMHEVKTYLNNFVNPLQPITLHYKPSTIEFELTFTPDTTVRYGIDYKDNNDRICKFNISGTAHNPMFQRSSAFTDSVLGAQSVTQVKKTIACTSDVPIGMIITLNSRGTSYGTIKNPYIHNTTTGETLTLKGVSIASDEEYVVIDTRPGHKYIGNLAGDLFSSKTLDSSWVHLNPGSNKLAFGAESGLYALKVTMEYYPLFWEVQR